MSELAEVDIERRGDVVIAHVTGELDLSNAPATGKLIESAVPAEAHALIVDFSNLSFLDSSGISMLFGLSRALGQRRQSMRVVVSLDSPVGRVLEVVDFGRAAPLDGTLEAALAQLQSSDG